MITHFPLTTRSWVWLLVGLQLAGMSLGVCAAPADDWTPEAHYADLMGGKGEEDEGGSVSAAAEIARWARQPSTGPQGRALPLAGSWNVEEWGPAYFAGEIDKGRHLLINFTDPSFRAEYAALNKDEKQKARQVETVAKLIADYYRPGLEYARKHRLPIAIRGWNWAANPVMYQERRISLGKEEIPSEQRANVLIGGKLEKGTDPFGPIAAWTEWGKFWFGNALMQQLQAIYPDPPLVIFLNNNEAGELMTSMGVEKFDRFIAKYGNEPRTKAFLDQAVREGYEERYAAMFAAAKDALVAPAWKHNVRFIAYNTLAGTAYIGNNKQPRPGVRFDGEKGWTQWRIYDGSMPELYDNDWQFGKTDNRPDGMQTEAGNYYAMQARVFAERPDFFWTAIFWDGAAMAEVFRGRRAVSKPFRYAMYGNRWDFARYEGWVQFCLWATRPRLAFEFRGGEPLDAIRKGTWQALCTSVDRPWRDATLREFWRFGELVPNTAEEPWHTDFSDDTPPWVKELKRWYLLTCDAHPPRATWEKGTTLSVFAEALVLDKAPNRRWLLLAHAPAGGVGECTVTVPGYGAVKLPAVSRSGSFYLLTEADRALKPLQFGGPEELSVTTVLDRQADWPASKWLQPGKPVTCKAVATLSAGNTLTRVVWKFGDGESVEQKTLAAMTHTYQKPGTYLVTVDGYPAKGPMLSDQTAVYIGDGPDNAVIYDLPLDEAIAWEGPWDGVGAGGQTLATYRHVPNRGAGQAAVVTGGRFVDDPERGRVFELVDDWGGLWLKRDRQTVITGKDGAANRTVAFWFKAVDVAKRQVLFASGIEPVGMNIYLDGGKLYAGSWAVVDGKYGDQDPLYGYNWKGDWITAGPIEPGKWYQVAWVLKDGTNKVEPDKQRLFLNGKLAGSAPGAAIPVEYAPPRVGRSLIGGGDGTRAMTRFHDQDDREKLKPAERNRLNQVPTFRGCLDDFRFVNAAE